MIRLLTSMPIPETREQQILLALGDFYGLTIPQVMEIYGWQSYPRATEAFKKITYNPKNHQDSRGKNVYLKKSEYIYRLRRHGLGKDTIPGDVYFLLSEGAKELRTNDYDPAFWFEPNKARLLKPGGMEHTLLVNEALIKLKLFADAYPLRFRVEGGVHERSMRKDYEKAFKLYPDGLIRFLIKHGNQWKSRAFFLEVEHTSASNKDKWQMKVRQYINLFE